MPKAASQTPVFDKSISTLTDVLDNPDLNGKQKIVLLTLVDHNNRHHTHSWASIPTIARRAGFSDKPTKRALRELREAGYIRSERTGKANRWYVDLDRVQAVARENRDESNRDGVERPHQKGLNDTIRWGRSTPQTMDMDKRKEQKKQSIQIPPSGESKSTPGKRQRAEVVDIRRGKDKTFYEKRMVDKITGKRGYELEDDEIIALCNPAITKGLNAFRRMYECTLQTPDESTFLDETMGKEGKMISEQMSTQEQREHMLRVLSNWSLFAWYLGEQDFPIPQLPTARGVRILASAVSQHGEDFANNFDDIQLREEKYMPELKFKD